MQVEGVITFGYIDIKWGRHEECANSDEKYNSLLVEAALIENAISCLALIFRMEFHSDIKTSLTRLSVSHEHVKHDYNCVICISFSCPRHNNFYPTGKPFLLPNFQMDGKIECFKFFFTLLRSDFCLDSTKFEGVQIAKFHSRPTTTDSMNKFEN